jgi:hypothetical protein
MSERASGALPHGWLTEGEVELIAAAVRQICRITGLETPVGEGDLRSIEMLIRVRSEAVRIPGHIRCLCFPTQIYIAGRSTRRDSLWAHAHAICHVLLHVDDDNRHYLCIEGTTTGWKARTEAQADLFAALLLPEAPSRS